MATRCSLPSGDCLPPEAEVRWVYQPVEVHYPDGHWAVGRITAWWTDEDGAQWCRMRMTPGGQPPRWFPYDPDTIHLLPSSGI